MTFIGWIITIVVVLLLAFAFIGWLMSKFGKSPKGKNSPADDKPTINITITGHFTARKEDNNKGTD